MELALRLSIRLMIEVIALCTRGKDSLYGAGGPHSSFHRLPAQRYALSTAGLSRRIINSSLDIHSPKNRAHSVV